MNNLSWLLYAADVADSLKELNVVAWTLFVLSLPSILLGVIVHSITEGGGGGWEDSRKEQQHEEFWETKRKLFWKVGWRALAASVLMASVLAAVPSRNTIYAIAISEGGERIVNSEAVQGAANDAMRALNAWIKKQIE